MSNFPIQFTTPWLLLLIIPLVGVGLLLYFLSNKKYRRTRNRIISLVLHCLVSVLCVFVLSGVYIRYDISNEANEVLFVVDVSDSGVNSEQTRDDFMKAALETGAWYEGYKVGVVTFGFDQRYAVPLTDDVDSVYDEYMAARLPSETGGTDIASALTYASKLFTENASAKIVLVTDGKETDNAAEEVIQSVTARGILVDTAYVPSSFGLEEGGDVQVLGVEYPEYHLNPNDQFTLGVTLYSNADKGISVSVSDNGEVRTTVQYGMETGTHTVEIPFSFAGEGFHKVDVQIESQGDLIEQNNTYCSYYYLEKFDRILILESKKGESKALAALLSTTDPETEEAMYQVTVLNLYDADDVLPQTTAELCAYDQVILNNVANKDLPSGFIDILYSYVNDFGGGMLTLGGTDEKGNNNAYNRSDMYGTTYQSMLPVEIINYTPPVAVMIIIDASGSMGTEFGNGESMLSWARAGAAACLDSLSERDYIGVMALNSMYDLVLPLTRRTQDSTIRAAISSIDETGGGTIFSEAINRAGTMLKAQTDVARRHIIIVTDGGVSGGDSEYLERIESLNKDGVTLSVVGIGVEPGSSTAEEMQKACDAGKGRLHTVTNSDDLILEMREDLNAPDIKDVNEYENGFTPTAYALNSTLFSGITLGENGAFPALLGGFFGSKVRDTDYLVLAGDFTVPLYAQWKFGEGTVGSFMCDLTGGKWSSSFMTDPDGIQFILNMVSALMPVTDIEPIPVTVEMDRENFLGELSIPSRPEEGVTVNGKIESVGEKSTFSLDLNTGEGADEDCYVTSMLTAANDYSRCSFVIKRAGVYSLILEVCDENGEILYTYQSYFSFSYSREFDPSYDTARPDLEAYLASLAEKGGGQSITDMENPNSIYENFIPTLERTYDPTLILLIAAILLFLLDIMVRKFKFKWIHELVREHKMKKANRQMAASPAGKGAEQNVTPPASTR